MFQGSAVGPALYAINSSDLNPVVKSNFIDKYADDTYLIVPSINEHSIGKALSSIEQWACDNNLKLNRNKSTEIVIFATDKKRLSSPPVTPLDSIKRESQLKILGVTVQDNLSMKAHVKFVNLLLNHYVHSKSLRTLA